MSPEYRESSEIIITVNIHCDRCAFEMIGDIPFYDLDIKGDTRDVLFAHHIATRPPGWINGHSNYTFDGTHDGKRVDGTIYVSLGSWGFAQVSELNIEE